MLTALASYDSPPEGFSECTNKSESFRLCAMLSTWVNHTEYQIRKGRNETIWRKGKSKVIKMHMMASVFGTDEQYDLSARFCNSRSLGRTRRSNKVPAGGQGFLPSQGKRYCNIMVGLASLVRYSLVISLLAGKRYLRDEKQMKNVAKSTNDLIGNFRGARGVEFITRWKFSGPLLKFRLPRWMPSQLLGVKKIKRIINFPWRI